MLEANLSRIGRTISESKCELGGLFTLNLAWEIPSPFYQPPCPLLRTEKERFILWAATPAPLYVPQCSDPEHRESKLRFKLTSPRQSARGNPREHHSERPGLFCLLHTGYARNERGPHHPSWMYREPRKWPNKRMSFYFTDRVPTFRVIGLSAGARILSGPLPISFRSWAQIWSSPVCPYSFLHQSHIYWAFTVCQSL